MDGLQAKDFKPDGSGFFSENLYKWLKKNPSYNKVYRSPWNGVNGYDPESPTLMIGLKVDCEKGWFHGNQLRRVCSGSRMDTQAFAYGYAEMRVNEWEDITEQFIAEYKRIGVCAIHGDWGHRFEDISKTAKKCLNCGVVYKRKSKRVTKHYWEKQQ